MDGCKNGTVKTQIILAAFHTDRTLVLTPRAWSWGQPVFTPLAGTGSNLRGLHSVVCWPRPTQYGSHFIDWRDTWGPFLIGEGLPHNRKAMKVMISISDLIQRGEGGNICLVFGLMVAPFRQPNTTCFLLRSGLSTYVGMCLPSRNLKKKKKISEKDRYCVFMSKTIVSVTCQGKRESGSFWPQRLSALKAFLLLGWSRGRTVTTAHQNIM